MAYAANITVTTTVISQRKYWIIDVAETEAANASEYQIPAASLPRLGRIVSIKATKTAGTGATIAPKAGLATGWSANTQAAVYATGTPAAHVFAAPAAPAGHFKQGDGLYVRSTPDAGADNTIATQIVIVEGVV